MRLYDMQERVWIERDGVNATEMLKRCPERYAEREVTEPTSAPAQNDHKPQEFKASPNTEPKRKEKKKRKVSPATLEALQRGRERAAANRAAKVRENERALAAE